MIFNKKKETKTKNQYKSLDENQTTTCYSKIKN